MFNDKQGLVIVNKKETKQCAEYLHGLIGELSKRGCPITAIVVEAEKFAASPDENKNTEQKILYIGDFPESNIVKNNIHKWKYCNEKLGVCYGWHGSKGVIAFDYGNRDVRNTPAAMAHHLCTVPPGKGAAEFAVLHFVFNCLADFTDIKDDNCVIFNFISEFIRTIYIYSPSSFLAKGDPLDNFRVINEANDKQQV